MFLFHADDMRPEEPVDEDAILISEVKKNPTAFSGIYERWEVPVYQYFYYRTGNTIFAEDLTSQLFLKVFESIGRYQHRGHFAAWLFTIARNMVAKHYRENHHEESYETASITREEPDPLEELALSDEIEKLKVLVCSLSAEEQDLIRLRYAADLKFSDIAIILHKREDAVKKSLYRLQTRLQYLLEQNND